MSACQYAANVEKATASRDVPAASESEKQKHSTPDASSIEDVAALLNLDAGTLVKTLIYRLEGGEFDGQLVAACLRGDDQLQEIKLTRLFTADGVALASDEDIASIGGITGFVGPQQLQAMIVLDETLRDACGLTVGANEKDAHISGLSVARDLGEVRFADLREVRAGDQCPHCKGKMELSRGIEAGHVFALGTRYTEPMNVCFQNQDGKRQTATMGCYGIGASRLVAAVVEQCHDEAGIIWPLNLAPFQLTVISLGQSEAVVQTSEQFYRHFTQQGLDVLWDERKERPGVKFKDAELMGTPIQVVVGDRSLENGLIELRIRGGEKQEVAIDTLEATVQALIKEQQS